MRFTFRKFELIIKICERVSGSSYINWAEFTWKNYNLLQCSKCTKTTMSRWTDWYIVIWQTKIPRFLNFESTMCEISKWKCSSLTIRLPCWQATEAWPGKIGRKAHSLNRFIKEKFVIGYKSHKNSQGTLPLWACQLTFFSNSYSEIISFDSWITNSCLFYVPLMWK